MLDRKLQSCHLQWLQTNAGASMHENVQSGRFYRRGDVSYDQVGPDHGNFISDSVSHAPPEALLVHLDCLVRTLEERLNKIRLTDTRFKDAGRPFADHMLPEMAPRELLRPRDFRDPDIGPLVDELREKVYRPTEKLTLAIDEVIAIQRDHLAGERARPERSGEGTVE